MQDLVFFIGKGGVGKTTVSAAYAVRLARRDPDKRVLLLSTDPAHSLSDVLERPLRDRPATIPLPGKGRLEAWQINPEKLFAKFLKQHKEGILAILDSGSMFSREDIEPFLDTTLPGMAEVSALLAIHDAMRSGKYSNIVIDTAPFGHTLRLFGLPQHFLTFLKFLELAASRDQVLADHFGGQRHQSKFAFVNDWRQIVADVYEALSHQANLILVTTPEKFSLNESLRCTQSLAKYSPPIKISGIVLNRAVLSAGKCKICRIREQATAEGRRFLSKHFPDQPLHIGEDPGFALWGVKSLATFGDHVFSGSRLKFSRARKKLSLQDFKKIDWPELEVPLTFVLGKGGVGKTTVSAALGFATRRKTRHPVQLCSVDPAPSLNDIFQSCVEDIPSPVLGDAKFMASQMDSVAVFAKWVQALRDKIEDATETEVSGIHIDLSFERELLSQLLEIIPPGVDEVLAIFRVIDLLNDSSQRVEVDMAPTGHALELLRMPERILGWTRPLLKTLAAHHRLAAIRDAGVQVAELGQRLRELASFLKNRASTHVHIVLLPEMLPDRETERLIHSLKKLALIPKSIFLNRVIFAKDVGKCPACLRSMQSQQGLISSVKKKYSGIDVYAVRNFPGEIAGKAALAQFTGELWQIG